MKTELVSVTPSLAREWLKKNIKNRAIRPSHVETLRQALTRGEQVTTHQGIAFDTEGELIDGQHRLTAISLMPEGFNWLLQVTWGLDRATVFPVVDFTQAKRSTSDVLRLDRGTGETANFLARLYLGRTNGITAVYVQPFANFIQPEITDLMAFCPRTIRTWSSAPVRAAAVLAMKSGDVDYTKLVYRALVAHDFESMPNSAQVLFRSHMIGAVRASDAIDIFARCLKVFDPSNANLKQIKIVDVSTVVEQTRELLREAIFATETKKAPQSNRGAKGLVYGRNSTARQQTGARAR
jgi:hypothetical protein